MSRTAVALAFACAVAAFPELASACAVCGQGVDDDQSRVAYLLTTGVLSLLPLALFGGFVLWLRRQHKQQRGIEGAPRA